MSITIIDKYSVRVTVRDDHDQQINQGSGVIIRKGSNYYVLTAKHCANKGNDKNGQIADIKNIFIERQKNFNSPFEPLRLKTLMDIDGEQDWALFQLDETDLGADMEDTIAGENLRPDDRVFFRGFQSFNNSQSRTFEAKIIDVSEYEFKITLTEESFNQGGELGADIAKGLSGSGVFIRRNEKLFLVGHLKSVVGRLALNDDIKCCAVASWKHLLPEIVADLQAPGNRPWNEDTRNLNDALIKRVFQALRKHIPSIDGVGKTADERPGYWDNVSFKNQAGIAVADNYIGLIGNKIARLNGAGKADKLQRQNQKDFIELTIGTGKLTVKLLTFIFLSKLWDCSQQKKLALDPVKEKLLNDFFDTQLEPSLTEYVNLLSVFVDVFSNDRELQSPVDELNELAAHCKQDSGFVAAFKKLEALDTKSENNSFTLGDCFDAELQLATVLEAVAFLSRYRMASVKSAYYHQIRNKTGNYEYSYTELYKLVNPPDKNVSIDTDQVGYIPKPSCTDAVMFYTNNYNDGTNLSPFIIDLSAMHSENGHQVYFYSSRSFTKTELLDFSFIEDNSKIRIGYEGLPDNVPGIISVLKDKTKNTQLKKDRIHKLFMEARNQLLNK
jgi:hypothetical protein